jgi:hypothetical protein
VILLLNRYEWLNPPSYLGCSYEIDIMSIRNDT